VGLSRAQIVDAAYSILREHGLGGLSMRRLARDLGVQPGALYYPMDSKQELLVAVADRIFAGDCEAISTTDPGWRQLAYAKRYCAFATARGLFPLLTRSGLTP
jgi:AcrR family transcriptional regulator